jgi:quinol monooxygenase YgiN
MTVVVTAVFHPVPGQKEQLVAALRATIPGVHDEAGCELYAIHDAEDGTITMIEKWTTRADLDAHSTGDPGAVLTEAVAEFIAMPTTVTFMTPIPAGTADQGEL